MKAAFRIASFLSVISTTAMAVSINLEEPKTITAEKIEYNVKADEIKTVGDTEITNKSGQRVTLVDSYISQKNKNIAGNDIQLYLGEHLYLESDKITRDGAITTALDATFTACSNCDSYGEAWSIWARKFVHDMNEHMMKFYSPVFYVYDLPVFWFPYIDMPDPSVIYKTGILMPSMESTNKMGTQINIPLYISLSDSHDLTFTFSYLTKENPLLQLEHRLNLPHSEFRTKGSYTHNKMGENRWHIFNDDVIELGDNARATIFLERTSDTTYLQKYGFYDAQPYLDSGAKIEVFGQSSYVVADAHFFQELREYSGYYSVPDGDILPNIRAVHQTKPLFGETYATFGTDILGISGDGTSAQRMIGDARLTTPWTLWGGNRLTASVSARYDLYHFNNTEMIDGSEFSGLKNRFLPSGYLEWGLPLFKPTDNWTQVIEPRARITFMRHINEDGFALNNDSAGTILTDSTLFSENRFAGLDVWENGTYSDYGVRWAAFNNTGKNIEVFLGQSYDFVDKDSVDINSGFRNGFSDYVGRIGYTNSKWLRFTTRFRLNEQDLALRHIESSGYIGKNGNYLTVGHIWSENLDDYILGIPDVNEAVIGAGLKLSSRWSVRWNGTFDVEQGEFMRHSGGLFYNHPCYYISAEYRRDNAKKHDYVGTTTFQFKFGMAIDGKQY
jgi:LPS-assembly protein